MDRQERQIFLLQNIKFVFSDILLFLLYKIHLLFGGGTEISQMFKKKTLFYNSCSHRLGVVGDWFVFSYRPFAVTGDHQ